jgi:hypothetical protein
VGVSGGGPLIGAFNTLVLPEPEQCPRCGSLIRRRVQFKYGDTWQYDYVMGDRIRWGGNDIGERAPRVKVLAYLEDCPVCGYKFDGVCDVYSRDDVIEAAAPGSTAPYIEAGDSKFVVIAP